MATIKRPNCGAFLEELFRWAGIPDPFPSAQAHVTARFASPMGLHRAEAAFGGSVIQLADFGCAIPNTERFSILASAAIGSDAVVLCRAGRQPPQPRRPGLHRTMQSGSQSDHHTGDAVVIAGNYTSSSAPRGAWA